MRKRINWLFVLLTIVAIIVTTLLATIVNYTVLKQEVIDDLRIYAQTLKKTVYADQKAENGQVKIATPLRITLVDTDGAVLYDSEADEASMGNHKNREEIKEALKYGEGNTIRHSETIGDNTIYYAVRLDNGNILRLAKNSSSIIGILMSALPIMLSFICIVIIVCIFVAHFLTKSIVSPIDELAQHMNDSDVTSVYKELRPFVRKIQKQHKEILQTAEIRQEFTANVSHELKTPLTAISGYAELISHGMVQGDDVLAFAAKIHKNANRLLSLINDIIRLSELDSTGPELLLEDVDLQTAAGRCVELLQMSAQKHQVQLTTQTESCVIRTNLQMIDELMYNLVDNAIRYNKKDGSVCLNVGMADEYTAYLEVKDTGIGIPKEHQTRVFERFYRVDKSRSKSTGGTGLGLAIVKHIVVQLHGTLSLKSEPQVGTQIRIELPKSLS